MLSQAKRSLCLKEPPPRCLLTCSLGPSFRLCAKRSARVFDAMLLAVALNLRDASIPCLPPRRIARPFPQLGLDVDGRGDPRRDDRQLALLRENLLGDRELAARSLSGLGQFAGLSVKMRNGVARPGLPRVDTCQLVAALATR